MKVLKKLWKRPDGAGKPDVEAHKVVHATDEPRSDDKPETPDVEAHKVQHKVQH